MCKPSFIIVGVERGGTTSIYHNICKHSKVVSAYQKEIEYFNRYYYKGNEWYHQQFNIPSGMLSGEATPTYFWNPKAADRIYEYNPKMKIIISLRDFDSAVYSKYKQQVAKGVEKLSFSDALKFERIRIAGEMERMCKLEDYYPALYSEYAYAHRYFYDQHLPNWERFNPLIIKDYFTNPYKRMVSIFKFIGLEPERHELEHLNKVIVTGETGNSFAHV